MIFGVHESADPAIPIIRDLIDEFPQDDLSLVIDNTIIHSNYKVSSLANMFRKARWLGRMRWSNLLVSAWSF